MARELLWWQKGVIYQIYPRSFMDATGDGIGDLEGIRQRLDHLQWLGIDAIWISPIYPSPMKDFGYDVSDYTAIDPMFGTLNDFDRLLEEVHDRGMKLILDLVPNHTSDKHPWFRESRSSRDDEKRDWYIWRDPAPDGGPPNNWLSVFGGSAWELDEATGQYYYHAFLREQPDLNWRNRAVRDAMFDVIRFWLRRGVDGFRIDVIWHLIKDDQFRDNPENPSHLPGDSPYHRQQQTYTTDRPEIHDVIREMRSVFEEFDDRVMIGEIYLPVERLVTYYGEEGSGIHLPYNFQLIQLRWDPAIIRSAIQRYEAMLPTYGWPNWVTGNHDKSRLATRVGSHQARVAAMLLLTLRGTPTIYYGEEIGMTDVAIPHDRIEDPFEKNVPGMGLGRDPERTPMQWDSTEHAGFSKAEPWLPLSPAWRETNVEKERNEPRSFLNLYRQLIELRRSIAALTDGDFAPLDTADGLIAYVRKRGRQRCLVVLNLTSSPRTFDSGFDSLSGSVVLSTYMDREGQLFCDSIELRADEGLIIAIDL